MRKITILVIVVILSASALSVSVSTAQSDEACWGQASAVFARMGEMGQHASEFETPRVGLRNLAVALYADGDGPLSEPTLQALGAFVAAAEGLEISACQG